MRGRRSKDQAQEEGRGTGRTTSQLRNAAHGAVFIWCNDRLFYPKTLARDLGRGDLVIYGPSVLCNGGTQLMGIPAPEIILDHAARFDVDELGAFHRIRDWCHARARA